MKLSLRARPHTCAGRQRPPVAPALRPLRLVLSLVPLVAVAVALAQASPARATTTTPWVTATDGHFVDTRTGNPVLLRGLDVTVGPSNLYQRAVGLGANFVRLTVTWEQLEPAAPVGGVHTYDPDYLATLDAQIAWYQSQNVNVLIDLHQSGWSSYFSPITDSARGEPPWLYAGKYPIDQQGLGQAKADFVTDPQIAAWYRDLLQMLITRYSAYPNVVGYEIYNEPQSGSLGNDHQATQTLVDWQAGMARYIASLDPARTIFFQTRAGGNFGLETVDLSGFAGLPHVALDLHDYYNGVGGLDADGENWWPSWDETHNQSTPSYQGTIDSQEHVLVRVLNGALEHGWGLIVGEWGTRIDDPNILAYQAQMLTLFARYQVSWTRWVLTTTGDMAILNSDGSPTDAALQLQQAMTSSPSGLVVDGLPKAMGSVTFGSTLSATPGAWSGPTNTVAYQWLRCDDPGSRCVVIAGATGATYTVGSADEESRLRVDVDVTGPDGSSSAVSAATVAAPSLPPRIGTLPQVTGQPQIGQVLQSSKGTWVGTVTSYAYQWLRCDGGGANCVPIDTATKSSYTAKTADVLHTLAVRVSATGPGGTTPADSAPTAPIAPIAIVNTTRPSVSGSTVVGNKLSADKGTWTGTISSYAYQWLTCNPDGTSCTPVAGATNAGYTTKTGDIGHAFAVRVTATGPNSQVSATSAATTAITAVPVTNTVRPSISGQTVIGQQLTLNKGTWAGTISSYAYQWLRCDAVGGSCTPIAGATKSTYTNTTADFGHAIKVSVTATGPGGTATATSNATAAITAATIVNVTRPTLTGTPRAGSQLQADKGSWTGTITSYAYQWLRCDAGGANCVALTGKTSTKYAATDADVGHALKVTVTATGPGGSLAASSAATAAVADLAPTNVQAPVLNGTPVLGHGYSLSIAVGSWNGSNLVYTYRWERCDANGSACVDMGLTAKSYKLLTTDLGFRLRAYVRATNSAGSVEVATALTPVIVYG
jgi:Cellulase (glycosyl hydrolase family 5)